MTDVLAGAEGDSIPQGTEGDTGQPNDVNPNAVQSSPEGTKATEGQPQDTTTQTEEQPTTTTESTEKTLSVDEIKALQQTATDYKELQGKFTKETQATSEFKKLFEEFGGHEQLLGTARQLRGNPEFTKWVQDQQQKQFVGNTDISEYSDEQKQAVELVQNLIRGELDVREQTLMQTKIQPLVDKAKVDSVEAIMSKMDSDKTLPPEWRQYQDKMVELSNALPAEMQDKPTYDDMVDLLWKSARQSGDMMKIAADIYAGNLEQKKTQSTEKPITTTMEKALKPAKTMAEAYEQAKSKNFEVG